MKKVLIRLFKKFKHIGFDFFKFYFFITNFFYFLKSYLQFKKQLKNKEKISFFPILNEKNSDAGTVSGHYFHQDLYVAKKVHQNNPSSHLDIGSRIDGFVAHLAVYRKVEVMDIRPLNSKIENIVFKQQDITIENKELENYCDSISSLHALEHIGLGRYGDNIDAYGHIKAINNIYKILKTKGVFYFSAPIGKPRIEFNAHRVFSILELLNILNPLFDINGFSFIDDKGDFHENVDLNINNIKSNFNCYYGCGIFILNKK